MKNQKSIVFISNILPSFDKDSGSNRLKEIIGVFLDSNYTCYYLVDNIHNQEKYYEYFKEKGVIIINKEKDLNYTDKLKSDSENIDYVWFNGPNSFKKHFHFIKSTLPNTKVIYDMVDIHFLRYKRAIALNPLQLSNYKRFYKYKKIETQLAKKADIVIAISEKEKVTMSKLLPNNTIRVISNIHYSKIKAENITPFDKRSDLLFIGSTHTPNIDAVHYLYNEIMPIVWKTNPSIKVTIIGNLDEKIKNINHPNFKFLGFVENIEPYFLNSKFMIAPLRYGAGVKGKIGQAYEYFLPVITTNIGAEGMNLIHNQNALIANNTDEFANAILKLYNDEVLWNKLSDASSSVLNGFSKNELHKTLSYL